MKKILSLVAILAFSMSASATTVQLSGLENVQEATGVDMVFQARFGDCTTYWSCMAGSEVVFGLPMEGLNFRLSQLNIKYRNIQLTTGHNGEDSMLYLKFLGYPKECRLTLSNKSTINAVIHEDGSCHSN